jgi:serine/threonine protein kinase
MWVVCAVFPESSQHRCNLRSAELNQTRYLVLELVDGETLAERIARGPLPIKDSLDIAIHVCEALEAAHEKN